MVNLFQLSLLPNLYRTKNVNLIVKIWNNEDHKICIGIKHHASVPKIIAIPNDIIIRFCFINYPANRVLQIKNESQLNCTFKILCLVSIALLYKIISYLNYVLYDMLFITY